MLAGKPWYNLPKTISCFFYRINPEDEAITIVNSDNVSIGGGRNVSLKKDNENGGEKSLLVPKVILRCRKRHYLDFLTFTNFIRINE